MASRRPSKRTKLTLLDPDQTEPLPKRLSAEALFGIQCRAARLPPLVPQWRFARALNRQWRFDWAFCDHMIAVEIEGLCVAPRCRRCYGRQLVVMGRHASIQGYNEDLEKYNSAALLGWTVLRFTQRSIQSKDALNMTIRVLAARGWQRLQE